MYCLYILSKLISQAVYTLEGCETAAQVAEEAQRAEILAPAAVVSSIVGSWFIGLIYMLSLLFSVQSIKNVQSTSYAIAIAQLYFDAVGQRLTLMCLTIIGLAQFMAAATAFTASSRLFYALARDNAFPMKSQFMYLNRFQAPLAGVWLSVVIGCAISCAYIGSIIAVRFYIFSLAHIRFDAELPFYTLFPCRPVQRYIVLGRYSGYAGVPSANHHPCILAVGVSDSYPLVLVYFPI